MPITIETLEERGAFLDFDLDLNAIRDTVRYAAEPAATKLLNQYAAFQAKWAPGGTLYREDFWTYYVGVTSAIEPAQTALIQHLLAFRDTLRAIEAAAPGTFGIELPAIATEQE